MKTVVFLLIIVFTMACCKSKEKLHTTPVTVIPETSRTDTLVVKENIQEDVAIEVKQEAVQLKHGDVMQHYCIIVGSFISEKRAVNLRNSLIKMGFTKTSIMQNARGMFRVSAVCMDDKTDALKELYRIRSRYSQFWDAWLLETQKM